MVTEIKENQFAPMNHIYRFYGIEDYVRSVFAAGYEVIDLWTCASHFFVDAGQYENTKSIKKKLKKYHLRVSSITPQQSCPNPFHMAVKKREVRHAAEKYFKNIIRAANELECPKISITSGWQQFSETREEAWNRSVDMIGDLCQFAQPYGICLTMETLSPQSTKLVNYLNDMKQMIQDVNSNQLTVTADIHTIHNAGENLQDYFDSFGKRLNHCHFMDYKKDVFAHLALGDGEADLKNILSVFKKNGYEGDFVLEYTDAKYFRNPHKAYEKTMKILRDVL